MRPRLKSITVSNFRSILGTVTVPLDSPVVIIHGHNGAGKTSLLSAIELGLTGQVASLTRVDQTSGSHLIHKQANEAFVSVTVEGLDGREQSTELKSINRNFTGEGLLSPSLSRFYSEHCYLAQSTLARLLEIYQHKDARLTESPLTKFVKELLGLDQLDALVDGLHQVADIRRLRSSAPLYWNAKETIPKIEEEVSRLKNEKSKLQSEITELRNSLVTKLPLLGLPEQFDIRSQEALVKLQRESSESELQKISIVRRDVRAITEQWQSGQSGVTAAERNAAEIRAKIAADSLQNWRDKNGKKLEAIFSAMAAYFSDLPSPNSTRPAHATSVALEILNSELKRCESVLAQDVNDISQLSELGERIGKSRSRIQEIDHQITKYSVATGGIAESLNNLLPHVHSDMCPVCNRDFKEISDKSLQSYMADRISLLQANAEHLQITSKKRIEESSTLTNLERTRSAVAAQLLTAEARNQLKTRIANLSDFRTELQQFESAIVDGEKFIDEANNAFSSLNALRMKDQKATTIREAAQKFAIDFDLPPIAESESLIDALKRIQSHVLGIEDILTAKEITRKEVIFCLTQINYLLSQEQSLSKKIAEESEQLRIIRERKANADARISQVKELGIRARDQRTKIVSRVFNESLNTIWSDLFVRLAPDEPFVPAFSLPEPNGGAVEALLETHYRRGGKGGNPRAMLSAGNLNTAALTLFLALHLSVKPALPWLLIDDPVQSMDEVHIAQFAALLRTLSKQHGRQIVVAVHEKPLFDYLALELSPAFPNDRLITIDISRSGNGQTNIDYQPRVWVPDEAISA